MKSTKTNSFKLSALGLSIALALPGSSFAQPTGSEGLPGDQRPDRPDRPDRPGRPERPERPNGNPAQGADALLKALDRNGDGSLQQLEIDLAVASLRQMDRNEDGEISPDEMVASPRMGRNGRNPDRNRGGFRGPSLDQLDKDGDDKISLEEAPERLKARFSQIDQNGDGFLDKAEQESLVSAIRRRFEEGGRRRPGSGESTPGRRRGEGDDNDNGGSVKPKRPPLEE